MGRKEGVETEREKSKGERVRSVRNNERNDGEEEESDVLLLDEIDEDFIFC